MARLPQEYAITPEHRAAEIQRKFGHEREAEVFSLLAEVAVPTDRVLGAIVFLARPGHVGDIRDGVTMANEVPERLLDAATVKDERG